MATPTGARLAAAAVSIVLHGAVATVVLHAADPGPPPPPPPSIDVWLAPAPPVRAASVRPRTTGAVRQADRPAPPRPAVRASAADSAGPAPAPAAPEPVAAPPAPDLAPSAPPQRAQAATATDGFDAYARQVWAQIDRRRPRSGVRAGSAQVSFRLDRAGRLTGLRLAASSGSSEFDRAALRAVRAAAPFPRPPDDVDDARLEFRIAIRSPSA